MNPTSEPQIYNQKKKVFITFNHYPTIIQHRTTKGILGVGLDIQKQERTTKKEQKLLNTVASLSNKVPSKPSFCLRNES